MTPPVKRNPRHGEYARRILRDTPGTNLQLQSEGNGTYTPPVNAFEAGVKVLYKYRPLGDLPVRADGTTATQAAVQLLTERKLYAATPSELNDVFELTVRHGETIPDAGLQFIRHAYEQAKQTADLGDDLRTFVENVLRLPADQLGPIHEAFLALLEADW